VHREDDERGATSWISQVAKQNIGGGRVHPAAGRLADGVASLYGECKIHEGRAGCRWGYALSGLVGRRYGRNGAEARDGRI
jgi:hypothetical protein